MTPHSGDYRAHGGTLVDLFSITKEEKVKLEENILVLPRITLSHKELCDLEMLLTGAFSPLRGFMTEEEYRAVVDTMRLPSSYKNLVWPMPITLSTPLNHTHKKGDWILLCDTYGMPIAVLELRSIYTPDRHEEARKIFGTTDTSHYGVRQLLNDTHPVYLGGPVTGICLPPAYDFQDLRHTPKELQDWFRENGWERVIAFQTRNPIHRAHFELIKNAANTHGARILIHPAVGRTKDGDIDYVTRVKTYKKIHENYLPTISKVSLLPIAMRMGGPREAVWHSIIRKNYGATHFIVGRDHAGPGKNKDGIDFYDPYEAQNLAKQFSSEIGIEIIDAKEMVYVEESASYLTHDKVPKGNTVKNISGTKFREMLRGGEAIPEWFSFPEVIDELRKSVARDEKKGFTVFFTGLSGSGKTTLAHFLAAKLSVDFNRKVSLLDGDVVREHLSKGLGFSREDRITNITRIGFVAGEITRHGGIAICSAIAPYEDARLYNRNYISAWGNYIEIYLKTPLEVCEQRDKKGLYKKARKGLLKNFTGISDPYEVPVDPELILDTNAETAEACVQKIIEYLVLKKLV
jgi:sulfate adenylyltransferase